MNYLQVIILGFIQGITEFLPVSSSGHLVIANKLMGLEPDIALSVILHAASLIAVLIYFRKRIFTIGTEVLTRDKKGYLYILYIIIGILPAVIAGLLFEDILDAFFSSLSFVGIFLLITSLLLFLGEKFKRETQPLTFKNSLIIGLMQILALLPGISRSGTTISTGLLTGLKREDAVSFSFLMAIPLIMGAVVLKIDDMINNNLFSLYSLAGFISSFATSWIAIDIMISKLKDFRIFSYYTAILGIICLLF